MFGPQQVIDGPQLEPPRRGLLESSRALGFVNEDPERWITGVTFERDPCAPITNDVTTWVDCASSDPFNFEPDSGVEGWQPYIVGASDQCTTLSAHDSSSHDGAGRARRKLLASTSRQVERELWNGTIAQASGLPNRYLTDLNVTPLNSGDPTPLVYAQGQLMRAIVAESTGRGMVHLTIETANLLHAAKAIYVDPASGLLVDIMGNVYVPGSGYDGAPPVEPGEDDGDPVVPVVPDPTGDTAWMYATGIVAAGLGQIMDLAPSTSSPDLVAETNLMLWVAQRPALALWDGCVQLGINVDLCTTCCTPS